MEGGSSRKPGSRGTEQDPVAQALGKRGVCLDAEACRVVWCRVKGYPWWPAQILSKAASRQHLGGVPHKSSQDTPVIFFGTSEIAWIGAKDVTDWESGMAQSFCAKGRKNKKFVVALEQVRDFLSLTSDRLAPPGWWCPAPARGARALAEEPASSDEQQEEPEPQAVAAAAAAAAPAGVQQPLPDDLQQQQQAVHVDSARQSSFVSGEREVPAGGSSFAAAAVAAAAAAAMSAEEVAELEQAAATAAAVMSRSLSGQHRHSSGRGDDVGLAQHNSFSSRSAGTHKSACQQIWGGGGGSLSGHPSLDGAAEQQALGRHQRKRRATRQLYDTGSEASESDGSEKPSAAAAAAGTIRSNGTIKQRNGSRGRGVAAVAAAAAAAAAVAAAEADGAGDAEGKGEGEVPGSFMQVKRRRLLAAEGDAAGSDSDATDLESLTMAAMAMAQLASSARGWQQPAEQQQPLLAEGAASPGVDLDSIHRAAAVAAAALKADEAMEDAAATDAAGAGADAALPAPPCKAEGGAAVQQRYEHGGEGLPCSHSWQYAVPMPGVAAVPAAAAAADAQPAAAGSGSGSTSGEGGRAVQGPGAAAAVLPAAAAAPGSAYYQQLFSGFAAGAGAGFGGEDSGEAQGSGDDAAAVDQLAAAEGLAAVAEAAAAADMDEDAQVATETAGLAGLQALAAGAAAVERVEAAAAAAAAAVGPCEQWAASMGAMPPGAFAEDPAAAAAAVISAAVAGGVGGGVAGFGAGGASNVQQHVAAVNALFAAFSASAPPPAAAALHAGHHRHHQHHHSVPFQPNSSSAAVSDRSAGSAGQRMGASISSKRRNAAAAAALAAAHTITPPHPVLDAQVADLLLRPDGPRLPLLQGLPDMGFRLPRELLLNRPPKFEWLKRNIFVSRERPKRLAKHDVHVCNCRPKRLRQPDGSEVLVGCTEGCLNRLSFIHCDPRTCPCGTACTNKPFHLLKAPPLEVFLTDNRGHGVRLTQPLDKGQFVVEYAGEVIDQAELQRRMDAARDSGEQHFYIMELAPGLYIDAKKKGNHARLLNSSCDPNCETQKWRDAATGEVRIGIFTTRPVSDLEELTYDYMFEHSGVGAMARGFKCMCGARNCRGTMDVNPDRKRDWGRRLDVFWEGDGVYYRGTVTGYSTSSGKHTVMYDDGDVERVKLTEVPHRWLDSEHSPGAPSPAGRVMAGDSGSWSQTDQEGSLDDAAEAAATVGPGIGLRLGGGARPPLGSSPLRPASAGVGDDAVAAADALAMLAAEAELEQQQQQQPSRRTLLPQAYEHDGFARPAAKRQRAAGYPAEQFRYDAMHSQQQQHQLLYHGGPRMQQQWQHSSSSSQSAGGHYGLGGVLDGHSPISPPGQRGFQPFRPPSSLGMGAAGPGLPQSGWANMQQQPQRLQQQHQWGAAAQGGRPGPRLEPADSQGEFLPWEQLLSGIRAIKTQGPPLFQKSSVAPAPAQRLPTQQQRQLAANALGSCGSRFGRLLDLVGQVQPDIQPPAPQQQQLQQQPKPQYQPVPQQPVPQQPVPQQPVPQQPAPAPQQQQEMQLQQQQQHKVAGPPQQQPPLLQAGRSSSWGGSSTTSSAASCQLPLFRAVNAQMSALLLQQQVQQQQRLASPRARAAQQQMPPPPAQQQWPHLPPMHPHQQHQQQQQAMQQQARAMPPPAKASLPSPNAASANAVAAALEGMAGASSTGAAAPQAPVERGPTTASFTKPQAAAASAPGQRPQEAAPQQQQQQQHQVVPDCVRAAVPDADSRAAAAAAAAVVQACCAGQAAGLGTAGSGGSTASADSALAAAAAGAAAAGQVPAMPVVQPAAGIVDLRHAQAVAQ